MSLVIPDFSVLALIAANPKVCLPKTTHRWPSGTTIDGNMCLPKMSEGSEHRVYENAPHGKYGNRLEPPLLIVEIQWVADSRPYEWTDEDMWHEGFDSLYTYGLWWDQWRYGDRNCKLWVEMQDEPFWVCGFKFKGATEYFRRRLEAYGAERQAAVQRNIYRGYS